MKCLYTFMWKSLWWVSFSGWSDPSAFLCWVQWSWKSLRYNWWRPSRINEARKSGQPLCLASQEAISGRDRMRAFCDVHAWTWGFRVMVCYYPSATPHKLRTSLSEPDKRPAAMHRRSLQRIDSTSKMLICYHMGVTIRPHAMSRKHFYSMV